MTSSIQRSSSTSSLPLLPTKRRLQDLPDDQALGMDPYVSGCITTSQRIYTLIHFPICTAGEPLYQVKLLSALRSGT